MSSLFAALGTAGSALDTLERAIGVVQNNVTNASTPGYATQSLQLNSRLFDPANNLWGGVAAGGLQSSRNSFAESSVWAASGKLGSATQQSTSLSALDSTFNVSGTGGVPGAFSGLFSAFSAWSTSPTSTTARQQVIATATALAQVFNSAASSVDQIASQAQSQTASVVNQVNSLSSQVAAINAQIRNGGQTDAGLQAQLYNTLEQLSSLVDVSAQATGDGTISVLMNGQVPLVTGATAHTISLSAAANGQQAIVSEGNDVTAKLQDGQLGGLLTINNSVIPSLNNTGDGINKLAQSFADRVNQLLESGTTSSGAAGKALFTYDAGAPARTLAINPAIKPADLAAADGSSANGTADRLAQLQNSADPADRIDGASYSDFYASIASQVGTQASNAAADRTAQTQTLTQAQNVRSDVSGVSLNDQAASLLQFQNAYEASAEAFTTISNTITYLLQTVQQLQ